MKFADDTTVIGLIQEDDESVYRREVDHLVSWCTENNLVLNIQKIVEMVIDFRRHSSVLPPLSILGNVVVVVESF